MSVKKKSTLSRFTNCLISVLPNIFNIINYFKILYERELPRALKRMSVLIILCVVSGLLIVSIWVCLLLLLFLFLIHLKFTIISALIILFLLNVILLMIAIKLIIKTKNNLSHIRLNYSD